MTELVHSPHSGDQGDIEVDNQAGVGVTENMTITMPVANINVGTRHRKEMGDIAGLARTIADVGLLHPIVVRPGGELIAGGRRLAAFKHLGWTEIPVTVVDLAEVARGELAENFHRKDFLPSEIDALRRALEPIEKTAAKERMAAGGGDQRSAERVGKISTPDAGKTRDKIGALVGVSGRTVQKIAAVVDAAEAEPAKFGHLVEEMDKTGKVDRAHQQLKVAQAHQTNAARAERSGRSQPPKAQPVRSWSDAPIETVRKVIEGQKPAGLWAAMNDGEKAAIADLAKAAPTSATSVSPPPAPKPAAPTPAQPDMFKPAAPPNDSDMEPRIEYARKAIAGLKSLASTADVTEILIDAVLEELGSRDLGSLSFTAREGLLRLCKRILTQLGEKAPIAGELEAPSKPRVDDVVERAMARSNSGAWSPPAQAMNDELPNHSAPPAADDGIPEFLRRKANGTPAEIGEATSTT